MSKKYRNLEIPVKGLLRSLKMAPFNRLYGFILVFYSNFVLGLIVFEIFDFKNAVTLKTGLGIRQGH